MISITKIFKFSLLLVFVLGLFGVQAVAADERDAVIVGTSGRFPPYSMLDDKGNPYGFAIDVMDAVALRAGLKIKYVISPKGKNIVKELQDGRIDVIPSLGISESRKETLAFTPIIETARVSFFLRQDTSDILALEDLNDRKVGVVPPNLASRFLKKHPRIKQVVYKDTNMSSMFQRI